MNEQQITCPKCGESISIDQVLSHQVEDKIRKELDKEMRQKEAVLLEQKKAMQVAQATFEESQKNAQVEMNRKVNEKLATEKITLWKQAQTEAAKEKEAEKKMLETQLEEKDLKLRLANEKELELRKEKNQLAEEKANFAIEKQRQLDEERSKIVEEAGKKATEEQQYVIAQLKKQLTDATKAKDDLARKLEQGSQQTQGEVLELELEETLRNEFLHDEITPVPKGVNGADLVQKVLSRSGQTCGSIVWEFKKTKVWNVHWLQKLKDDQRQIKADIAIIVSTVLPPDVEGFALRDGVWICDVKMIVPLATTLRITLESLTREKAMSVGKNEKMEVLYSYLTGVEFQQRVEAIVEAFVSMENGLRKERVAYEKIWSEREKQIRKVISNTAGMYGDIGGLITLPQIKTLELDDGAESSSGETLQLFG